MITKLVQNLLFCVLLPCYIFVVHFYRLGQSVQTNNEDLEEGVSCRQGSLSGRCLIKAWLFKLVSDDFLFFKQFSFF